MESKDGKERRKVRKSGKKKSSEKAGDRLA